VLNSAWKQGLCRGCFSFERIDGAFRRSSWHFFLSALSNRSFAIKYCLGQLIGTSVGSILFVDREWRVSAAFGMAWYGFQIAVALVRGPHCKRGEWVGY
jgi:hypothetical protein